MGVRIPEPPALQPTNLPPPPALFVLDRHCQYALVADASAALAALDQTAVPGASLQLKIFYNRRAAPKSYGLILHVEPPRLPGMVLSLPSAAAGSTFSRPRPLLSAAAGATRGDAAPWLPAAMPLIPLNGGLRLARYLMSSVRCPPTLASGKLLFFLSVDKLSMNLTSIELLVNLCATSGERYAMGLPPTGHLKVRFKLSPC